MSIGLGGGSSSSTQKTRTWDKQDPFTMDLWRSGSQLFNGGQDPLNNMAVMSGVQAAQNTSPYTQQAAPAWGNLLQGGQTSQATNPWMTGAVTSGIMSGRDPNMQAFSQFGAGNPYLDQMATAGMNQINRNFTENLMPAIKGNAIGTGGLFGSRQGVAEGQAAGYANQQASDFIGNLYGGQYQSDMNRGLAANSAALNAKLGATGQQGAMMGQADTTGINALGQGQNMMNLGMGPAAMYGQAYNQQWSPMSQFKQVIGNPVLLGSGSSSGWNLNGNIGI